VSPAVDGTDDGVDPDGNARLTPEKAFETLKNERRRRVLRYLDDNESEATLGGLAEHIAGIENDKPARMVTSNERKAVYVALYQCHLPKMDDMGVVTYDRRSGRVEPGPNAPDVTTHLDNRSGRSVTRPPVYLSAGSVGAVAVMSLASRSGRLALGASALTALCILALATFDVFSRRASE